MYIQLLPPHIYLVSKHYLSCLECRCRKWYYLCVGCFLWGGLRFVFSVWAFWSWGCGRCHHPWRELGIIITFLFFPIYGLRSHLCFQARLMPSKPGCCGSLWLLSLLRDEFSSVQAQLPLSLQDFHTHSRKQEHCQCHLIKPSSRWSDVSTVESELRGHGWMQWPRDLKCQLQ